MESIELKNVYFKYSGSGSAAIKDVCLKINKGDFILVAGISGSGKTTLLRQLKPAIRPNGYISGDICVTGTIDDLDNIVGYVLQSPEDQFVTEYVWHEIAFGLESRGENSEFIRKKVAEISSFFGLEEIFDKKVSQLSGGQKQMVALASVMSMDPEVIVLDEPISRLDPISQINFLSALERLNSELGTTIVLSAHTFENILPICSRLIVMDEGEVVCDDKPDVAIGRIFREKLSVAASMPCQTVVSKTLSYDKTALTVREGISFLSEYIKTHQPAQPAVENSRTEDDKPIDKYAVSLKSVYYSYDGASKTIRDLNLNVGAGQVYGLLGGNGAGKTTLLSIISGILKKQSGRIIVSGCPFYMPQDPRLMFRHDRVSDELVSLCSEKEEVDRAVKLCRLDGVLSRHPYDLSGGEQQRLAVCIMILRNADIFLLDEPTKGMDAINKNILAEIIRNLKTCGKTVIIATHDIEFCAEVSDVCGMIFDGKIISQEKTRNFISGNIYYTTAAYKIAKGIIPGAITTKEILNAFGRKLYGKDDSLDNDVKVNKHENEIHYRKLEENSAAKGRNLLPIILLAMIPVISIFIFQSNLDRKFFVMSLFIATMTFAAAVIYFEKKHPSAGEIVILAVICSVAVAGRVAFFAFSGFKPLIAIVIIAGVTMGKTAGFLTGMISMFVSNFVFGQGIWTVYQMFASGIIGFLAGFFSGRENNSGFIPLICIFGAASTFAIYGAIVNPSYILAYQNEITLPMIVTTYVTGIPFDALHGVSTAFFLAIFAKPTIKKIKRAKLKYNIIKY